MRKRESCRFGLTLRRGPLLKHTQRFVERFNSRVDDLQFLVQIIEAGECITAEEVEFLLSEPVTTLIERGRKNCPDCQAAAVS